MSKRPSMEEPSLQSPGKIAREESSDLTCVALGETHQGDARYKGKGRQCTAMAAVALVYSAFENKRSTIAEFDFDRVLQTGDDLYVKEERKLAPHVISRYLCADEIPTTIPVGENLVKIERNWAHQAFYPHDATQYDYKILELKNALQTEVFKSDWNDNKDGCVFTGANYSVSFWRYTHRNNNVKYYIFNSHGVDENNKSNSDGVARIFELNSLKSLASALMLFHIEHDDRYDIFKFSVINTSETNPNNNLSRPATPTPDCTQSEVHSSPHPSGLVENNNSDPDRTQCSRSSVSSVEILGSLSILSGLKLDENIRSPRVVPTQLDMSQGSTVSGSTLNNIKLTPSTTALSYAAVVKTNLRKPIATTGNTNVAQTQTKKPITTQKPVVVINRVDDFKLSYLRPVVVLNHLESSGNNQPKSTVKRGRPIKNKGGRKKTKENAQKDAVKKYIETNPQKHRDAVKKYSSNNPIINREAVKKYTTEKPKVHRDAAKKYTSKKPEVNREAVKKYTSEKPDVHREAVKKYSSEKPEVHREAVKKYTSEKPKVNREAVKKYTQKHPEVHREAVKKYDDKNPQVNQESTARYNQSSRNVDVPLRRSRNLIGEKRDAELNSVNSFALKNPSLKSSDTKVCQHCQARLFNEETSRKQWCCGSGANNIQTFAPLTEDFYTHPSFQKRPRAYNNLFAFSALGVSHGFHQPEGLSFLKIQGRTYHRVFDLAYNQSTNNIGLYINDPSERENLARNQSLDVQVTRSIRNFLENVNPFINCFKRLHSEASDEAFIVFKKTSRATDGNVLGDHPIGREISALISTNAENYVPRSIAIWKVGESKPHTVDIMHPLYECFQYPLLYPEGNTGWIPGKLDNNGNKLTQARYVRCLLLSEDRFSLLNRLSEECIVDFFCRISEERLRYILNMQANRSNELRAAPLQELLNDETIAGEGVVPGRIYLPNTFTGGPRYMKLKYLDCIALVNRLGPPSYFITFTCNPNWPEIKQSIPEGQRPNPLICARVFNLRLLALIRDLRSGAWFGTIEYLTYVIEFQKRGLPHAHICFRVQGGGPVENVDIDKVCRADIPDALEAEGRLRKAVLNHMIHGPCGRERDNLPCYDKEKQKCSKRFPKLETDVTFCDDKGFIHLSRNSKNEGVIRFRNKEIKVNDLWVVPYNASLLLKYDAHINVEISSHRSIVKYLFKYMTKGPDEARVAIVDGEQPNEIEDFVTKRYIGSSDAAWRILEFDVTSREPNVKQLTVHLENQQTVYFKPGHETDVNRESSDLLTYFNRPQGEPFDTLKYADFYEKYIVHPKRPNTKVAILETTNGKFLTERQRGQMVARLFWVAPNRGEQFYLRILLNYFACRGYTDLLSLGGPDCTTFQEAAKAVGLADDEVEYERAMQEASTFFTGHRLRRFFVLLAVNGAPVASLWVTFKNQLCEDILHRMPNEFDKAYNLCLTQINRMLRKHGSSLASLGLPEVQDNSTELARERVEYNVEQQKTVVDEWLPRLSSEQLSIFKYIDRLCVDQDFRENNPCAIFIDGPAGTGKTTLLNTITAHVRGNLESVVICTASSAIAAQNLDNAFTAHSMFKFPLDILDDTGYWNITNRTQRAELIFHATVIIYDEAPMAHKYLMHMLDRSLRDLMKSDKIFGGKIIIFAGDFRQIPPVVVNAKTDSDILNSSLKKSPLWQNLNKFTLVTSQRCRDDPEYAEFLLKLGSNELPTMPLQVGRNIQRIVSLDLIEHVTALNDLIDFVFSYAIIDEPDVCALRAILCTRNDAVREINSIILDRVSGEMLHFYSSDKIENDNADELYLGLDALNRLQPQGVPEFDLKLKVGCVCMITRNLSFADGLVNGTKVIVTATSPRLITVRKRGCNENIPYLIPRILFKAPIERNSPYEMSRRQFPLQVCYAMTIHKSQGQTISRVGVDLRSDVFSHGQLYVALGRVQEKESIKILVHQNRVINGIPCANNKIIQELIM